jgi:hypothetical protein
MSFKILAFNPRKQAAKKSGKKKPARAPAKKGKDRKMADTKKPAKKPPAKKKAPPAKRAMKKNPSARGILEGTVIPGAAKNLLPMVGGALLTKVAQKRFGDKTSETANWTWKDYLAGFVGAFGGSLLARFALGSSQRTQQKILEGGLLVLSFKLITQELVPLSDAAQEWLGEDEDGEEWRPGDTYRDADGNEWILGEDAEWYAYDPQKGQWAPKDVSGVVQPPGRLGGVVQPPGRLGGIPTPNNPFMGEIPKPNNPFMSNAGRAA